MTVQVEVLSAVAEVYINASTMCAGIYVYIYMNIMAQLVMCMVRVKSNSTLLIQSASCSYCLFAAAVMWRFLYLRKNCVN